MNTMMMTRMMAEDCGAPELRNLNHSAVRSDHWLRRLFVKMTRK